MVCMDESGYELEQIDNMTVEDIRRMYSDGLIVWLCGSGISASGRKSNYRCVLEFGGVTKFLSGDVEGNSPNKAMIEGAIAAVSHISKPIRLYFISATTIGFKAGFKGKGANGELMQELFRLVLDKNCCITEVIYSTGSDMIKKYVSKLNPDKRQMLQEENILSEKQKRYKEIVYKECLEKVRNILINYEAENEVINEVMKITI